ncbi:hypothetical protein [Candidatus Epulonipiscium viviparus]|uniref:hypothetical protein n=1 Tax=Candidatus Epulonipiscium viviparus TaxID=420336 RepID=UPI0027380F47|nr:hypothetical protein [Candidatus Epulopiscium viviparus]
MPEVLADIDIPEPSFEIPIIEEPYADLEVATNSKKIAKQTKLMEFFEFSQIPEPEFQIPIISNTFDALSTAIQESVDLAELEDALADALDIRKNVIIMTEDPTLVDQGIRFVSFQAAQEYDTIIEKVQAFVDSIKAEEETDVDIAAMIFNLREATINFSDKILEGTLIDTSKLVAAIDNALASQVGITVRDATESEIPKGTAFISSAAAKKLNDNLAAARAIISTVAEGNSENTVTAQTVSIATANLQKAIKTYNKAIRHGKYENLRSLSEQIEQAIIARDDVEVIDATADKVPFGIRFVSSTAFATLDASITAAKAISILEVESDVEVDAVENLIDAVEKFENSIQIGTFVDTSSLRKQIEIAQDLQADIAIIDNSAEEVAQGVRFAPLVQAKELSANIAAAQAIVEEAQKSQNAITTAIVAQSVDSLRQETNSFGKSIQTGTFVDTTKLRDEIKNARRAVTDVKPMRAEATKVLQGTRFVDPDVFAMFEKSMAAADEIIGIADAGNVDNVITPMLVSTAISNLRQAIAEFSDALEIGSFVDAAPLIAEIDRAQTVKFGIKIIDANATEVPKGIRFVSTADSAAFDKDIAKAQHMVERVKLQISEPIPTMAVFEEDQYLIFTESANDKFIAPLIPNFAEAECAVSAMLTPEVVADLASAPNAISVMSKDIVTPKLVANEVIELQLAVVKFKNSIQTGSLVDVEALKEAIVDFEAMLGEVVVVDNEKEENVRQGLKFINGKQYENFDAVLSRVRSIAAAPLDLEMVGSALTDIHRAMKNLQNSIKVGTFIDVMPLEYAINAALEAKVDLEIIDKLATEVYKGIWFVTPAELEALDNAIFSARDIADSPPSLSAVDDEIAKLSDATITFKNLTKVGLMDTSQLWDQIKEITQLSKNIGVIDKPANKVDKGVLFVTPNDLTAINIALDSARKVAKNPASVAEIAAAQASLEFAYDTFKAAAKNGTFVDTSTLLKAIEKANDARIGIVAVDKDSSSIAKGISFVSLQEMMALDTAIARANEVVENPENDRTVAIATIDLKSAVDIFQDLIKQGTFVSAVNTSALTAKIKEAHQAMAGILATDKSAGGIAHGTKFVSTTQMQTFADAIGAARWAVENSESDSDVTKATATLAKAIKVFEREVKVGRFLELANLVASIEAAKFADDWILVRDSNKEEIDFGVPFVRSADMKNLEKAIAKAESTLISPKNTAEIDSVAYNLDQAVANFKEAIQTGEFVDTSNLIAQIGKTTLVKNDVQIDNREFSEVAIGVKFISNQKMKNLDTAIAEAKSVAKEIEKKNDFATPNQLIATTIESLQSATAVFESEVQVGTFIDKAVLQTEIRKAKTLRDSIVVSENAPDQITKGVKFVDPRQMAKLTDSIAAASAVVHNSKNEGLIEAALLMLQNAITMFESRLQVGAFVDATPLITEVANAVATKSRVLDQDTHCHDAHQELEKAIAIAEAVIAHPKARPWLKEKYWL